MYTAIIIITSTGAFAAFILYFFSRKFEVIEDPRIAQIIEVLPGANCGGCGYPGCGGFANACIKAVSLDGLSCPVGTDVMKGIATILGMTAGECTPEIAVIRCNGRCDVRPRINIYDGAKNCNIVSAFCSGDTGCSYGCLGWGDCVDACQFDAIHINPGTGLAEVSEEKCTACRACVKACPKNIIEIRKKTPFSPRIFVSCVNKDKGGVARKACKNACIGCSKCVTVCSANAITLAQNLANIDDGKCNRCGDCVPTCPTGAINKYIPLPPSKGEYIHN